jgi:hypothetical protein
MSCSGGFASDDGLKLHWVAKRDGVGLVEDVEESRAGVRCRPVEPDDPGFICDIKGRRGETSSVSVRRRSKNDPN